MKASEKRARNAYAAIDKALNHLYPSERAEELSNKLREHFNNPASIFEAFDSELEDCGMESINAIFMSRIPDLLSYIRRDEFGEKPVLNRLPIAVEYLKTLYIGMHNEMFYLLCLDSRGALMECVLLQQGSVDSANFYVRHAVTHSLHTGAKYLLLSHNHPGNTLRPSADDIKCTIELLAAIVPMGTYLLDHIIIAGDNYVSIRECGSMRESVWLSQSPNDKLLSNWFAN